jgi:hypothetical protein|tara:strand:- start:472 stop:1107 length:636 start_codon:yes stop_codon:yes gene_type:complete
MAIARVQISTAIVGKEAEYMAATSEGAKLMQSKGLKNFLRVSHSGTPGIEVWSMTMFKDWEEYGAAQDMMQSDADIQQWYLESITNRTGEMLDSFEMVEVPGFERGAETSGDIVFATAWNILPEDGMGKEFIKSCYGAKEIHEKHGAKARLWQGMGGGYSGKMIYSLGYDNFTEMGKVQQSFQEDFANFNRSVAVTATIDHQLILRASTIL